MKPQRQEILTGVYFNHLPVDTFKMSHLSVYLTVPLRKESATSRLALLPHVLKSGTKSYPSPPDLVRRQEELYSADLSCGIFKTGDTETLYFSVGMLRREFVPDGEDLLPPAADLLCELIFHPYIDRITGVFSEEYVVREKKTATDRILAKQNHKPSYARAQCLAAMYEGEAYGISELGTIEELQKVTPAALFATYRNLLAEAHAEIFYTGTEAPERVTKALLDEFKNINRHLCPLPKTDVSIPKRRKKHLVERADANQGNLCIGFRSGLSFGDPQQPAFSLFHMIYGSSATSKLFVNVRERLGLCYTCRTYAQSSKGLLMVYAGIENAMRHRALREIYRQFKKMRLGKITEKELEGAKTGLVNQLRMLHDDPAAMERWYFVRALFGVSETPEEATQKLLSVTTREIAAVARRLRVDTVYFLRGTSGEKGNGGNPDAQD